MCRLNAESLLQGTDGDSLALEALLAQAKRRPAAIVAVAVDIWRISKAMMRRR